MSPSPELRAEMHSTDHLQTTIELLKRENDELRQLNAVLSLSNQDLDRFAFAASHDLQEPLRVITIYAELLVKTFRLQPDSDAETFVSYILESGRRMSALLADLLAYAEIGALPVESAEPVDLNIVVEKIKKNLQMSIQENSASVVTRELPTLSAAHEFHFVQLFQNLVGNAIKYRGTENPLIRISAQDAGGTLEFEVTDNGIGVAFEDQQKIFQPFKRLHYAGRPGTGIGLAICQRVVERYGGRIWVDSQRGYGSTFRFTLPNVGVSAHKAKPSRLDSWKLRVVVVDDDPTAVDRLGFALEKAELNCELTVIADRTEALAFVRQQGKYASSPTPDLAVLDLNISKNDVLQVLAAMRENRAFRAVPAVVLSSGLSHHDLDRIHKFKLAHYFPRPSTPEEFLHIGLRVKSLLDQSRSGRSVARSA